MVACRRLECTTRNLTERTGAGDAAAAKLLGRQAIDFQTQLTTLSRFLDEHGYRHALVGALALAAYGLPRTTLDLDIAVEARGQDDVVRLMESTGYETLHRSDGYSNHLHPDPERGRVDFIYLDARTAEILFSSTRSFPGPEGTSILVPRPEHLAAMKAVATKNDPSRALQDLADVRFLLQLPGVDRAEIRGYFEKNGLKHLFDELERSV
jgi:hypothetical protein